MLSVQPIVLPAIKKSAKQQQLPQNTKSLFYLSWEDALWDILEKKHVPLGSTVLVPSFFCGDVEENIRSHGYTIAYYPVSKNLQTPLGEFIQTLKNERPAVVVVFHAVGITNTLFNNHTSWIHLLGKNTLLIEDCVHRIIEPNQVRFLHANHFLITSLRKVVPLQGSILYGKPLSIPWSEPPAWQSFLYTLAVTAWWFIMVCFWKVAHMLFGTQLAKPAAQFAEWTMLKGYDLIGDAQKPAAGWKYFFKKYQNTDFLAIKKQKAHQVQRYEAAFPTISTLYVPADRGELRGWPLVLQLEQAETFVNTVRKNGLLLRLELNDSVWSKEYKIVYLPLGTHISKTQQNHICSVVNQALQAAV